jgi:hypothetical protein
VQFVVSSAGNWRFSVIVLDLNILGGTHFEEKLRYVEVAIAASCTHRSFAVAILGSNATDSAHKIQPLQYAEVAISASYKHPAIAILDLKGPRSFVFEEPLTQP